ncbi:LysR family transcriptional regulator [Ameyamaea chiangmaiensis NBRC 103196]|uniref:LysR family transcriptional regulator n=1 Tax=Ameyamaea chiangmaiensis TaxID=442969 RepID=A0A850P800_9PROT|nr:LysR family transcriptional regulator [Ameyamaea chiangmaiensis]MBS4073621.1 LysR family transcriptional regulator [Ameyamaea chiangmaiensis]NVN40038.1 LysR family transcriptional regulator [Ameyamaea chiangmaiensis]GBQ69040.1 LysR family transcriptional regulator [Ameyamaea chiangmaiensis NBRC 103196]
MELRHLRYFVAVADHGGFTRAAAALHMEQPPLSQQIRLLERELGVVLFERLSRGARLTEAGEGLIDAARAMLRQDEAFHERATGLARGEHGRLRVGLAGAVSLLPLVPQAVRLFREAWPGVVITLEESNTPALSDALREHRIDIAIIRPPLTDPTLQVTPLLDEPTVLALPSGHPASNDGAVDLARIAGEPFIIFDRQLGPGFFDAQLAACQAAGFTPNFGQVAPQIASAIPLVAAGLGVAIVPDCLRQLHAGGVTYHAIKGPAPTASLAIAARPETRGLPVVRFGELLKTLTRDESVTQQ